MQNVTLNASLDLQYANSNVNYVPQNQMRMQISTMEGNLTQEMPLTVPREGYVNEVIGPINYDQIDFLRNDVGMRRNDIRVVEDFERDSKYDRQFMIRDHDNMMNNSIRRGKEVKVHKVIENPRRIELNKIPVMRMVRPMKLEKSVFNSVGIMVNQNRSQFDDLKRNRTVDDVESKKKPNQNKTWRVRKLGDNVKQTIKDKDNVNNNNIDSPDIKAKAVIFDGDHVELTHEAVRILKSFSNNVLNGILEFNGYRHTGGTRYPLGVLKLESGTGKDLFTGFKGKEILAMINSNMLDEQLLINFGAGKSVIKGAVKCKVINVDVIQLINDDFMLVDQFYDAKIKFEGILFSMALHHMKDEAISKILTYCKSMGCKNVFIRDFACFNDVDIQVAELYDSIWTDHLGDTSFTRMLTVGEIEKRLGINGYSIKLQDFKLGRFNALFIPMNWADILMDGNSEELNDSNNEIVNEAPVIREYVDVQVSRDEQERMKVRGRNKKGEIVLAKDFTMLVLRPELSNVKIREIQNCNWYKVKGNVCKHVIENGPANFSWDGSKRLPYDEKAIIKVKSGELKMNCTFRMFYAAVINHSQKNNIHYDKISIIYVGCGVLSESQLTYKFLRQLAKLKKGIEIILIDPAITDKSELLPFVWYREPVSVELIKDIFDSRPDRKIAYFTDLRRSSNEPRNEIILKDNALEMSIFEVYAERDNFMLSMHKFDFLYDKSQPGYSDKLTYINFRMVFPQAFNNTELRGIYFKNNNKANLFKQYDCIALEEALQYFNMKQRYIGSKCYNCQELGLLNRFFTY